MEPTNPTMTPRERAFEEIKHDIRGVAVALSLMVEELTAGNTPQMSSHLQDADKSMSQVHTKVLRLLTRKQYEAKGG